MIKSASYSRLVDFESCAFKAWLKHSQRIADPRPSEAADRGTAIHQMCEDFVRGKIATLPSELSRFSDEFASLRRIYEATPDLLDMEQEWGFDKDWQPAPYKTAWFRMKADCVVHLSPTEALVVDYKTGRKFGNEVKHGEQLQLYSMATFIMYPELKKVECELWYLDDKDDLHINDLSVPKSVALNRYMKVFDKRAKRMTNATEFPPNPNIYSCKYCGYGDSGHCDKRVSDKVATANFFKRRHAR